MSWSDGEAYCMDNYGTNLASIHDEDQNVEASNLCYTTEYDCYIGLNDIDIANVYVWTDGSLFDYDSWSPSEPSATTNEYCIRIAARGSSVFGAWGDRDCEREYAILCNKFNPTADPTSYPTKYPTIEPTQSSESPSAMTSSPTSNPTSGPTTTPTIITQPPSISPSEIPSRGPTTLPSEITTESPTANPPTSGVHVNVLRTSTSTLPTSGYLSPI